MFFSLARACTFYLALMVPGRFCELKNSSLHDGAALIDKARQILSNNPLIGVQNQRTA